AVEARAGFERHAMDLVSTTAPPKPHYRWARAPSHVRGQGQSATSLVSDLRQLSWPVRRIAERDDRFLRSEYLICAQVCYVAVVCRSVYGLLADGFAHRAPTKHPTMRPAIAHWRAPTVARHTPGAHRSATGGSATSEKPPTPSVTGAARPKMAPSSAPQTAPRRPP